MKITKFAVMFLLGLMPFVHAQELSSSELWELWRSGFEKYEKAEALAKKDNAEEALKLYTESQQIFLKLKKSAPEWNKEVVFYRLSLCNRRIDKIKGGKKLTSAAETIKVSEKDQLKKNLQETQEQLRATQKELLDAKAVADRAALSEKQVRELIAEKEDVSKKLATAENRIERMQKAAAENNVSAELQKQLIDEKKNLEKAQKQISNLKVEIERLNMRCENYLQKRTEADVKAMQLEEKLKILDAKTAEVIALTEQNQKLADSIALMKTDAAASAEKLTASGKRVQDLEKMVADFQNGAVTEQAQKDLLKELEDARKNYDNQRLIADKLKDDLAEQQQNMKKASQEHQKTVMELVKTTETLSKVQQENKELSDKVKDLSGTAATGGVLSQENARLKKDLDTVSAKYEELRQSAAKGSEQSAKILEMQDTIDKLKADLEASAKGAGAGATVAILKDELEKSNKQVSDLEIKVAALKQAKDDIEKKSINMVDSADFQKTAEDLKKAQAENRNLLLEISKVRTELAEAVAALKSSETSIVLLKQQITDKRQVNDASAKKEIEQLTATVTELMEGRSQYETAVRTLTSAKETLTEENKELKLSNAAYSAELATLKKKAAPDGEEVRKMNELLKRAENAEVQKKTAEKKLADSEKEKKILADNSVALRDELANANIHIERLRKELEEWNEAPLTENEAVIARKDKAIDELIEEIDGLKKESEVLKNELTMAQDEVSKYKDLGLTIAENLQKSHAEIASLKTKLARAGVVVQKEEPVKQKPVVKEVAQTPAPEQTQTPAPAQTQTPAKTVSQDAVQAANEFRKDDMAQVSDDDKALAASAMKEALEAEKEKDYDSAIVSYWRAANANPYDWNAHFALAKIYVIREDASSAEREYNKAISLGMAKNEEFEKNLETLKNTENK